MHELVSQALMQVVMVWRRRWYVLAVAWVFCTVGWLVVAFIPDTYQSSARVHIDTQSLLGPLLKGLAVEINPEQELEIMQRTLLSRPNMEKVARMTDLDLTVEGPAQMERLVERLQGTIKVDAKSSTTRVPNLFSLSYESSDAQLAQRVVQALLTIYVESNLGSSRTDMDAARRFIGEQIADYERQLDIAEQRLAQFKQSNMGLLPGERGASGYYQRLETARNLLATGRSGLQDAIAKRDELKRQISAVPQFFKGAVTPVARSGGPPSEAETQILELEKAINDMLIRYTPKHPDVVTAQRRLENLRKQIEEEQQAAPSASPSDGTEVGKQPNPVYEQIQLQLVGAEADIARLSASVTRQEAAVNELEMIAHRVPAVEAELAKLNRDYSVIKQNYEALLSRREAARMAEQRESKSEKVIFRVVEPPQLPNTPTGPPRLLFMSAVLVVGLGAGVGFGAVLANIRKTFFSVASLKQAFNMPILGAISLYHDGGAKMRGIVHAALFAVMFVGLIGTYGGVMYAERSVGLRNLLPAGLASQVTERVKNIIPSGAK